MLPFLRRKKGPGYKKGNGLEKKLKENFEMEKKPGRNWDESVNSYASYRDILTEQR